MVVGVTPPFVDGGLRRQALGMLRWFIDRGHRLGGPDDLPASTDEPRARSPWRHHQRQRLEGPRGRLRIRECESELS